MVVLIDPIVSNNSSVHSNSMFGWDEHWSFSTADSKAYKPISLFVDHFNKQLQLRDQKIEPTMEPRTRPSSQVAHQSNIGLPRPTYSYVL